MESLTKKQELNVVFVLGKDEWVPCASLKSKCHWNTGELEGTPALAQENPP